MGDTTTGTSGKGAKVVAMKKASAKLGIKTKVTGKAAKLLAAKGGKAKLLAAKAAFQAARKKK